MATVRIWRFGCLRRTGHSDGRRRFYATDSECFCRNHHRWTCVAVDGECDGVGGGRKVGGGCGGGGDRRVVEEAL